MANSGNRKFYTSKDELSAMFDAGHSAKVISEKLGVGNTTVLNWAHKFGINVDRPYGEKSIIDISGQRFDRLVAIKVVEKEKNGAARWLCKCDCGSEKVVSGSTLRAGITRSCGCLSFERNFKGCGNLSACYWNRIIKGAEKRNLKMSVSIEDAWAQYQKQNQLCAISGEPIKILTDYSRRHHEHTASFDRINHDRGYIIGNTQWVHRDINMMRRTMSIEEFISWCKLVADNCK